MRAVVIQVPTPHQTHDLCTMYRYSRHSSCVRFPLASVNVACTVCRRRRSVRCRSAAVGHRDDACTVVSGRSNAARRFPLSYGFVDVAGARCKCTLAAVAVPSIVGTMFVAGLTNTVTVVPSSRSDSAAPQCVLGRSTSATARCRCPA